MSNVQRSWWLLAAVLVVIAGWQFASGQQGPARGQEGSRFQMEVDNGTVHVMDTRTGQVWRHSANGTWQQFLSLPTTR